MCAHWAYRKGKTSGILFDCVARPGPGRGPRPMATTKTRTKTRTNLGNVTAANQKYGILWQLRNSVSGTAMFKSHSAIVAAMLFDSSLLSRSFKLDDG